MFMRRRSARSSACAVRRARGISMASSLLWAVSAELTSGRFGGRPVRRGERSVFAWLAPRPMPVRESSSRRVATGPDGRIVEDGPATDGGVRARAAGCNESVGSRHDPQSSARGSGGPGPPATPATPAAIDGGALSQPASRGGAPSGTRARTRGRALVAAAHAPLSDVPSTRARPPHHTGG